MEDFIPYDLAVKLRDKGFNCNCLFAFNDEQIINPDVVETYGVLSDDGYYELTKDGGGELDWDYVYIYETKLMLKRNIILKRNFIDAPTISQVLNWLRNNHNIFIVVFINDDTDNPVTYEIYKGVECVMYEHKYYSLSEWNNAEVDAIEYVLNRLM